ncbi:PLP-dependent aminotransferase family protein [Aliiglaciecola sp. CAU 1673]|uniref:aminotransferase-like domain-containing protein n=1 Tax=Aliiglaciecola sp. CAU 1673 TaxID=3032595 RepID=UPI0023DC652B|nr:PLP-dependent aminotransferase family protein [Aliiglaciecola sp. CAU 1673]MDF2177957.1 PLP-dependent aminotransferase family protein [Aliiglaciecola sp. CAU 1673]
MTIWTPTLDNTRAKYKALASAIAEAIKTGSLKPGEKLPPQRRLADALNVTIGTVTRGYLEAERQGLLEARVGSGTYVKNTGKPHSGFRAPAANADAVDMMAAFAPPGPQLEMLQRAMQGLAQDHDRLARIIDYAPELGHQEHRLRFAHWLDGEPVVMAGCNFLFTQGGQHGISVSLNALCREGDAVVTDALVFPGILAAAQNRGVKVHPVEMDEQGMVPDKLAHILAYHSPKLLYLTPNHQNPTCRQMPLARREQIVALCRQHKVMILEDDVQFVARSQKPPSLQQLAPDITLYVSSFSKRFSGAMRLGFVVVPECLFDTLRLSLRASSWTGAPLPLEWFCTWFEEGEVKALDNWLAMEMQARHRLAQEYLGTFLAATDDIDSSFNLYLPLPDGWLGHEFVEKAAKAGALVRNSDEYRVGPRPPEPAIRLCLSRPANNTELVKGLAVIRRLLEEGPELREAAL